MFFQYEIARCIHRFALEISDFVNRVGKFILNLIIVAMGLLRISTNNSEK